MRRLIPLAAFVSTLGACSGPASVHDDPEPVGWASAELVASDPVSKAVTDACSTTSVKGLATQLIDEIQCLAPGSMTSIAAVPNTQLETAVFPWLQTPAANALKQVAASRSTPLVLNSALRTLPQQYLLYRWYQTNRCGIGLAAKPGTSNHESGLAVDVSDEASWRTSFQSKGWKWLGSSDPVHFDYVGGKTVDLSGLSVKAFQRLWNRNHPSDTIAEDGSYGPDTEARLVQSPVGGFQKGANCKEPPKPGDAGAGADAAPPPPTVDAGLPPPANDAAPPAELPPSADEGGGCNASGATGASFGWLLAGLFAVSLRRRRSSQERAQ